MEVKDLNIIPSGEMPVIHASQFDVNRTFKFNLKEDGEDYELDAGISIACAIKKVDGNLVTFEVTNTEDKYIELTLPEQATACAGINVGEVIFTDEDNYEIGSINFILDIERSPKQGGIESASSIHDLTEQIETITAQIIGNDYYNKTEVDALLDQKADISDIPDMSDYYDKSEVDNLLDDKADLTDLPDMNNYYNKTQVDNKLDQKANISDLPDMSDYYDKSDVNALLAEKADISDLPDMSNYYTKTQIDNKFLDIMPVNSASGAIVNFTTSIIRPFESITVDPLATTIYRRGVNLWDEEVGNLGYYDDSGNWVSDNTVFTIKNPIYVKPNTNYYAKIDDTRETTKISISFWDKNGDFISRVTNVRNSIFTTPNNTFYILFNVNTYYGTTYRDNISINYPSTDTSYHPYDTNSVVFDVSQINTITPMSGDNVFFTDNGNISIEYKQTIQEYIDSKTSNANRSVNLMRSTVEESEGDNDER